MTHLLYANQAESTLAGSISSGATVANLASGTGALFPNPSTNQAFYLTFNDAATGLLTEVVLVTGRSTDQITITRGQQGTTAQIWNANDLANQLPTAGDLTAMIQADALQAQAPNYAADSGTANAIIVTLTPMPNPFSTGTPLRIQKSAAANTSQSVTVQIVGVGTYNLLLPGGAQPNIGQLPANGCMSLIYNGTSVELQSGGATGLGTAAYKTASDNAQSNLASIVGAIAVNNLAVWADINGSLKDGGTPGSAAYKAASNALLGALASVSGATTVGHMAGFADTSGSVSDIGAPTAAASNAQIEAAGSSSVFASPSNMFLHPASIKAWVIWHWTGSSVSIVATYNIGSVSRTAAGAYTITGNGFTLSAGWCQTFADDTNNLNGNGAPGSGANPAFSCVFQNRSGGGTLDPNYAAAIIIGTATS